MPEQTTMQHPVINIDPDIMGGTPVFRGTRVPIKHLFDYIFAEETLDDFLEAFPTVRREQVLALMRAGIGNVEIVND